MTITVSGLLVACIITGLSARFAGTAGLIGAVTGQVVFYLWLGPLLFK